MPKRLKINTGIDRNEVNRTDHVKNFIKTLYDAKPLTKQEEEDLFKKYFITKDESIKDTIIKSNLRFVFSAAKAFTNDPEDALDLTLEGMIGLIEAFDRYNPENEVRFLSFAHHYVYKHMVEYTHKSKFICRSKDLSLKNKTTKIKEAFYAKNGRYPSEAETIELIKENFGIDVKEQDYIRDIVVSRLDSNYVFGDGESVTLIESPEFTKNDNAYYKNDFSKKEDEEYVNVMANDMLSILSERDREIVKKLFGIGYEEEMSSDKVAEEYGMTVARINQIKKECIEKMKKQYSVAV